MYIIAPLSTICNIPHLIHECKNHNNTCNEPPSSSNASSRQSRVGVPSRMSSLGLCLYSNQLIIQKVLYMIPETDQARTYPAWLRLKMSKQSNYQHIMITCSYSNQLQAGPPNVHGHVHVQQIHARCIKAATCRQVCIIFPGQASQVLQSVGRMDPLLTAEAGRFAHYPSCNA